jgi:hypothetical protein
MKAPRLRLRTKAKWPSKRMDLKKTVFESTPLSSELSSIELNRTKGWTKLESNRGFASSNVFVTDKRLLKTRPWRSFSRAEKADRCQLPSRSQSRLSWDPIWASPPWVLGVSEMLSGFLEVWIRDSSFSQFLFVRAASGGEVLSIQRRTFESIQIHNLIWMTRSDKSHYEIRILEIFLCSITPTHYMKNGKKAIGIACPLWMVLENQMVTIPYFHSSSVSPSNWTGIVLRIFPMKNERTQKENEFRVTYEVSAEHTGSWGWVAFLVPTNGKAVQQFVHLHEMLRLAPIKKREKNVFSQDSMRNFTKEWFILQIFTMMPGGLGRKSTWRPGLAQSPRVKSFFK